MYKAVIFDFFDVIHTDGYRSWLDLHGFKREGNFKQIVEQMDHGIISLDEFLQKLGDITNQSPKEVLEEMEGGVIIDYKVIEIVENLRANYKVGLLSNASSDFIRTLLKEHDLEKYFDEIVISSEVGLIKPNAEIFNLILYRLNIKVDEAIFIDDNEINVHGCEAVGIKGVLYTNVANLNTELSALGIKY